jgi:biopolymer transport protein ExbD
MAGIAPATGRGGRRALDAAVNVVPFIDLLSCCIAFLLITAAWTQLSHLDVQRAGRSHDQPDGPPPPALTLADQSFVLELDGAARELSTLREVASLLRNWRAVNDRDDLVVSVTDGVGYAQVVAALDVARGVGFAHLSFRD